MKTYMNLMTMTLGNDNDSRPPCAAVNKPQTSPLLLRLKETWSKKEWSA